MNLFSESTFQFKFDIFSSFFHVEINFLFKPGVNCGQRDKLGSISVVSLPWFFGFEQYSGGLIISLNTLEYWWEGVALRSSVNT
jgi:hypothetical protein